jgi:hypothetical protein
MSESESESGSESDAGAASGDGEACEGRGVAAALRLPRATLDSDMDAVRAVAFSAEDAEVRVDRRRGVASDSLAEASTFGVASACGPVGVETAKLADVVTRRRLDGDGRARLSSSLDGTASMSEAVNVTVRRGVTGVPGSSVRLRADFVGDRGGRIGWSRSVSASEVVVSTATADTREDLEGDLVCFLVPGFVRPFFSAATSSNTRSRRAAQEASRRRRRSQKVDSSTPYLLRTISRDMR